jgi:hypothetical protein
MTLEDAFGVGIDHKTVMDAGVEENAVGGFAADAVDGEQTGAHGGRVAGQQSVEIGIEVRDEHPEEVAQPPGLDVEVAGRPDELGQLPLRQGKQRAGFQHARAFEIGDGLLDIGPGGVLRENGSDGHFERRLARPPAQVTVVTVHEFIGTAERPDNAHGGRISVAAVDAKVCLLEPRGISTVPATGFMDPTTIIFLLLMYAFQFWMLVDAIRRQEWIWAIFIGLSLFVWKSWGLSAILYYFLVYRQQASGPSFAGFELPGMVDRRRIRELEAKIHHLDNAQHHLQLGDIYFQQGKYDKAEAAYRAAFERDGGDPDIQAHLGQCLLRQGNPEEALELLQKVAQSDPKHDYGHTLMALAETHMKLGSNDSAIQLWERVLENHSYPRARVQLAELYVQRGELAKARNILEETLADEEHSPTFQRRRDRVWISRAKTLLRQAKSGEPT